MLPVFIQAGSVAGPIGIAIMTAAFVGQMVWQNAKHIHEGEDDVKKALVLLGYSPGTPTFYPGGASTAQARLPAKDKCRRS
jgi:hypothetical protein